MKKILFRVKILFNLILDFLEDKFHLTIDACAGGITTTQLVEKIFLFCEAYSGKVFYAYQEQFSKRVIRSFLENDGAEITALFARQSGKCFAKDTLILMSDGHKKKVQDIKVGDYVMRPNGEPALVTNLGRGREEMYEVKSREKNHESFTVNKSHILSVVDRKGKVHNISVEDYLKLPNWKKQDEFRGYRVPVEYNEFKVNIDPYFLGLWIGDGTSRDISITNIDDEVINYLEDYGNSLGLDITVYSTGGRTESYALTRHKEDGITQEFAENPIRTYLRKNNMLGNKHIPDDIMLNSRRVRLEFLAGLIDSDGHYSKCKGKENTLELTTVSEVLANQYVDLLRSLGFRTSKVLRSTKCNGKVCYSYRISSYGDFSCVPIKIERKKYSNVTLRENPLTFGFDLVPKGVDDYYGFTIDTDDHLFLLGDYTVTHNTETIATTVGGMMIILPQLANMPMFAEDKRLSMFKDGVWVGIFSPSLRQSQITYNRMRNRLSCKEAVAVLEDPDFRLEFTTSNGQTVALSNGSYCTAISASDNSNIEGDTYKIIILEECQDISNYKIQKSIHPMAAAYNGTIVKIGTATTFKGDFYEAIQRNKKEFESGKARIKNHFEYNYKVVMKYNPKYAKYIEREKRSLGEDSDAFRMSYNLEWIISRGMFVDINEFERNCGEDYLGRVHTDLKAKHIVGIDVGGGSSSNKNEADSTVITVIEVDWDSPAIMEVSKDEETGEDIIYTAYNTYIKDWFEISPEIANDYNEQYELIISYLKRFRIARLVIDATREASLGQRIQANVPYETILFTFSSKSKSEIYKHLQTEINTCRARFPKDMETVATKEYQKFIQQMGDLQKSYSGSNLVVSHPDERGAHDDFPDSWALAVWGAKEPGQVDNTETLIRKEVMREKKSLYSPFRSKNRFTARRR